MPMILSGHAVRPFFCCRVIGMASSILNSLPAILGMSVMPMSRLGPWGEQNRFSWWVDKYRFQYSILICTEMSCFVADRIS